MRAATGVAILYERRQRCRHRHTRCTSMHTGLCSSIRTPLCSVYALVCGQLSLCSYSEVTYFTRALLCAHLSPVLILCMHQYADSSHLCSYSDEAEHSLSTSSLSLSPLSLSSQALLLASHLCSYSGRACTKASVSTDTECSRARTDAGSIRQGGHTHTGSITLRLFYTDTGSMQGGRTPFSSPPTSPSSRQVPM